MIQLRNILGFNQDYDEEENIHNLFGDGLENMPNLHTEITEDSDEEQAAGP